MDFDAVQIACGCLAAGERAYRKLLAAAAEPYGDGLRFTLAKGAVELVPGNDGLLGLAFTGGDASLAADLQDAGVRTVLRSGLVGRCGNPATRVALDHIVIHSLHADRSVRLWRDRAGLRLALDRVFPERGLRLLFFRSAGVTIEVAVPLSAISPNGERDRLWGVAFAVPDLEGARSRLLGDGFQISNVRDGQKRGTRVATVRSPTFGVPTLLIEHTDRR